MATNKKVVNGITFDAKTPDRVVNVLLRYMGTKERIRVFYGDPKTGRDYGEEWDVMGYVRYSAGRDTKIPILVNNTRSYAGDWISDGIIVRITVDKRDVYRHPRYKCDVSVKGNEVYLNGKLQAVCKNHTKAEKLAAFYRGDSNVKG